VRVYFTLGRSPKLTELLRLRSDVVVFNRFAAPSVPGLFTLDWMCSFKREQARRERERELRLVNSL